MSQPPADWIYIDIHVRGDRSYSLFEGLQSVLCSELVESGFCESGRDWEKNFVHMNETCQKQSFLSFRDEVSELTQNLCLYYFKSWLKQL